MTRELCVAAATVTALLALVAPAGAQVRCPEGRTASGACVDPVLASGMRQSAVIFSQPKLSYTAFPILPADDWHYRYPNQVIPPPPGPAGVTPTGIPHR